MILDYAKPSMNSRVINWFSQFWERVLITLFHMCLRNLSPPVDISYGEGPCWVLVLILEVCRCCAWILPWNVVRSPSIWVWYGNRTSLLLIVVHSTLSLKMPWRLKVHINVLNRCFVNQSCTGWRRGLLVNICVVTAGSETTLPCCVLKRIISIEWCLLCYVCISYMSSCRWLYIIITNLQVAITYNNMCVKKTHSCEKLPHPIGNSTVRV